MSIILKVTLSCHRNFLLALEIALPKKIKISSLTEGNYRPVSLTSIPGKMMEQIILEVTIKQVEEKKVIRRS